MWIWVLGDLDTVPGYSRVQLCLLIDAVFQKKKVDTEYYLLYLRIRSHHLQHSLSCLVLFSQCIVSYCLVFPCLCMTLTCICSFQALLKFMSLSICFSIIEAHDLYIHLYLFFSHGGSKKIPKDSNTYQVFTNIFIQVLHQISRITLAFQALYNVRNTTEHVKGGESKFQGHISFSSFSSI